MVFKLASSLARLAVAPSVTTKSIFCLSNTIGTARSFSSLPALRPSLQPVTRAIIRPCLNITSSTTTTALGETVDVVPKSMISLHPVFLDGVNQIRCGPRNTMNGHTRLLQKRRHGYLSRKRSRNGRKILERRQAKGRSRLAWG